VESGRSFAFLAAQLIERQRFQRVTDAQITDEEFCNLPTLRDTLIPWFRERTPDRFPWEEFAEKLTYCVEGSRLLSLG
jgi:hypothetical protein